MPLRLSRKWIRQLIYATICLFGIGILFGVIDTVFYKQNAIPSTIQNMIPHHGSTEQQKMDNTILQDILIKDCSSWINKNCQVEGYIRNEVDLRLGKSWTTKTYLFKKIITKEQLQAQKSKQDGTTTILDIYISDQDEKLPEYISTDLGKAKLQDSGWKYYTLGIWIKYGVYHSSGTSISNIDILFGPDAVDPRPNWNLLSKSIIIDGVDSGLLPRITFKKGHEQVKPNKPVLKIDKDSKFKILQVADLHFSTGVGVCRDPYPESSAENCEADPRTIKFINKVLDIEKPNLVVLTGDQIFGESSYDSKTTLFKALAIFIERKIPYTLSFGNHDDEGSMTREQLMALSMEFPYCLAEPGPEDVDGVGNYLISIQAPNSKNSAVSLWFLDSHKYSTSPKTNPGYDWLKESQLQWMKSTYTEPTIQALRDAYTHIHLSMAFFHIPLPEYRETEGKPLVGTYKEGITAPNYNTGGHATLKELGVSVLTVGHDHCNDYCLLNEFWLCYGGASGEGGYGGYGGTARRLRVFEIDTQRNDIRSWKRLETDPDDVVDSQVLVSGGQVVES